MVKGEETNIFSNALGKTVIVEVCSTCTETTKLLLEVLDNDMESAELLATEIHRKITLAQVPIEVALDECDIDIDINDLGIWIDPIDSTADYINGKTTFDGATGLHMSGLRCVTVLIGAYSRSTGHAVLGVVNQPFYTMNNSHWRGQCYWGFAYGEKRQYSFPTSDSNTNIVILSRAENPDVKKKLQNNGYDIIEVAGAGYKILSVAIGLADFYVLSKATTFRWDTCGPQALLRSLGGSIIDFTKFTSKDAADDLDIKYSEFENVFCNAGGFVAYRDPASLANLRETLVL